MTLPMSDSRVMRDLSRSQSELNRVKRELEETAQQNRHLRIMVGAPLTRLTIEYPNLGDFLTLLNDLAEAAHPLTVPDRDPDRPRGRAPIGSEATPGGKVAHWSRRRGFWNQKLYRLTADLQNELDDTPRLPDERTRCNARTDQHARGLTLPPGSTICSICHQPLTESTNQ